MDFRLLHSFATVAEEQNITRAAKRLATTQPALSVQMQRLEEQVGAALFAREGRGIRLTEAGAQFLVQAREILRLGEVGIQSARRAAAGQLGDIDIGHNLAAEFVIFRDIFPAFRKNWPDIRIRLHSLQADEVAAALHRGVIDIGFGWVTGPIEGLEVTDLSRHGKIVAIPAGHKLASRKEITVRTLDGEPLILAPRSLEVRIFGAIESLFARAGATLEIAAEAETLTSALNFVSLGIGCAILADYCASVPWNGVVYRPLYGDDRPLSLGVLRKEPRSPAADALYRSAVDGARTLTTPHNMLEGTSHRPGVSRKAVDSTQ
ncbi:MAG: transcriptional regulator, LysR family [Bradyrhizobium sp.]|nr:transcriptional regulator, LysR family [Bradyrhizobium sp.]